MMFREDQFSRYQYREFWGHEKRDLLIQMLRNLYRCLTDNPELLIEMAEDGEVYVHEALPLIVINPTFFGRGAALFLEDLYNTLAPDMEDITLFIIQYQERTFVFVNYFSEVDAWSDCTWDCSESCGEWASETAEDEGDWERIYESCMEECYECPEKSEAFSTVMLEVSARGAVVRSIFEEWGYDKQRDNIEDIEWNVISRLLEIFRIEVEVEL